ncbi:response regulator transcription factor [Micromonospora inositola]|uniref:Two component transcriptional regulator, LuxR family n=1 Tax=Micromonospora inositola TaxID=47865 RepID=A0A1C5K3F7_9ACTN|nr:response regulator transcription factor [Micromonospora inositola]SCG77332.1 two component transcriptional regulator, LuxR family [Micromonospora inositola]
MTSLRVVIADDHPVFRSGLQALLAVQSGIEVVGEAATGVEAVRLAAELQPHVVLMDLQMPDLDGVAATKQITRDSPRIAVLVFTMFDDDDSVFAAMRAGARGYLLKGTNHAEVVHAVHLVGSGGAMFGPAVAQRVIEFFARPRPIGVALAFPQLTDREHEILDLLAQGQSNTTIANRLRISDKTVRNHVSNIFAKLAVADRAQAIARARDAGLGQPHRDR